MQHRVDGSRTVRYRPRRRAPRSWLGRVAALLALVLVVAPRAGEAQLSPGDVLVIDRDAGSPIGGALFRVDATTGHRVVLSDFGLASQGPRGVAPPGVAFGGSGQVLVVDPFAGSSAQGALFRVDATTGQRVVLSDFGQGAEGPLGFNPVDVATDDPGLIWVVDHSAGTSFRGALFLVHPTTGDRVLVSDFGGGAQGPLGSQPSGVGVEGTGEVLVADFSAGTSSRGALFRIDAVTGQRVLLSDFGQASQGPLGLDPFGVALEHSGEILVADPSAGASFRGALFRIDPASGQRALLSDFGQASQGPLGVEPRDVAVEDSGAILVADGAAGTSGRGALFRVDRTTGQRVLLSDFGEGSQGPLGRSPFGVTVVPLELVPIVIDIRPDSPSNPINLRQRGGAIAVAIVTTSVLDGDAVDFDPFGAADPVDPSTLAFGPAGAAIVHATGHAEDVDGDGDLDMVLHFDGQEAGIACDDTEATLSGATLGGQTIAGTDSILIVGCP